jgi:hypothetical protein
MTLFLIAILAAYMLVNVARTLSHHYYPRLLIVRPLVCDVCCALWASILVTEVVALYVMENLVVMFAIPAVGGGCLALVRLLDSRGE